MKKKENHRPTANPFRQFYQQLTETWGGRFTGVSLVSLTAWLLWTGFTQGWGRLGTLLIGGHGYRRVTYAAGVHGLTQLEVVAPIFSYFLFALLASRVALLLAGADSYRVPKEGGLLFYMLIGVPKRGYSVSWEVAMVLAAGWTTWNASADPRLNHDSFAAGLATALFMVGEFMFYKHVKRWYMTPEEISRYDDQQD